MTGKTCTSTQNGEFTGIEEIATPEVQHPNHNQLALMIFDLVLNTKSYQSLVTAIFKGTAASKN